MQGKLELTELSPRQTISTHIISPSPSEQTAITFLNVTTTTIYSGGHKSQFHPHSIFIFTMTTTTTTPDPRQLPPDPRLSSPGPYSPATYSRDVVISNIISLYQSLPHIDPSDIQFPPPGGWPEITSASLAARGLHKTDEVVEVLRNLPYISGEHPWVAPDAFALDYREVLKEERRHLFVWELAGYDDSKSVPPWVVQLTTGKSY
jgi:hypothetical protein